MRARAWAIAFLLAGLGLAAWLIASVGLPAIAGALGAVGFGGLLAVLGVHVVASVMMAAAWWVLRRSSHFGVFVWGRFVRDGGSEVLPLSQVGGFMLSVRVLVAHGVAGATATATTMADAILEFLAEIGYLMIGLALVAHLLPNGGVASWSVVVPIGVAVATVAALVLMRRAPSERLRGLVARLVRRGLGPLLQGVAAVRSEMIEIAGRKQAVALSFLLHLAAWIVSGIEAWMALRFMGVALGLDAVLGIESLVYATRSLGFMVPNAIGIQEGAYVVLGASLGLAPEFALGLSLLKRGRDVVLGIPALASWHLFETRRAADARASAA